MKSICVQSNFSPIKLVNGFETHDACGQFSVDFDESCAGHWVLSSRDREGTKPWIMVYKFKVRDNDN